MAAHVQLVPDGSDARFIGELRVSGAEAKAVSVNVDTGDEATAVIELRAEPDPDRVGLTILAPVQVGEVPIPTCGTDTAAVNVRPTTAALRYVSATALAAGSQAAVTQIVKDPPASFLVGCDSGTNLTVTYLIVLDLEP